MAGCAQTRERIIYVGYARPPAADGAVKIATNEPIAVTVSGKTDHAATLDLGGWYAITGGDLQALVDIVRLYQAEHAEPSIP